MTIQLHDAEGRPTETYKSTGQTTPFALCLGDRIYALAGDGRMIELPKTGRKTMGAIGALAESKT